MLKAETLEREQLEQIVDDLREKLAERDFRIEEQHNELIATNESL
jgi:molybdopterin converting factor small subunit